MSMKQILVIIAAVVGLSVMADEVVITDPVLKEVLGKMFKKPYGKFAPPMKLTETEVEKVGALDLSFTQITDEGIKELAKLPKLHSLAFSATQITDKGVKEVAKRKN